MEEQYGSIYIHVGDEISLKECHNKFGSEDFLPHLAHTIITRYNEAKNFASSDAIPDLLI